MAAFYLKYRPQSLDELVGQEPIKQIIKGAFSQNKLSHAYLLVGPRGTGKTSTARVLAKMVNCLEKDPPCNKCSSCKSITDGSNLDLIEIDAASNRGIEDIRSLRENIKLSPTSSSKKVYIIDEVHMLTPEAFNALLKTLEEPPSHALFILATTEVQKLPQTILSRVQRLDFQLALSQELMQALQKIVTSEKIDIDEDALKVIVSKAEGSFRDGVKILDQISSLKGKITQKLLQESLKSSKLENILEFVKFFSKKNTVGTLSLIVKMVEEGVDCKELILSLMGCLRQLVFIKNGLGEQLVKVNYLEDNYQELLKISENFTNLRLINALDLLQKALEKMKASSIPSLPLELAMVEICGEDSHINQVFVSKPKVIEDKIVTEIPIQRPVVTQDSDSGDIKNLKEKWTYVCETIRPYNFSLEALLRSINIKDCTVSSVLLEVPYSFHQRILEAPKNRDLLEGVLSDILGRSIQVSTVLGARTQRQEDIQNIEVAADDEIIRAAAEIFNSDTIN